MRQALHIFRKDVRYLRIEIGLFLLLAAAFAWVKTHLPRDDASDALIAIAAAYLIGRAVHADAVPGDRQFWLTRPYRRSSLSAAKLLFALVCVCVPIAIAQIAVVLAWHAPLAHALAGLVCSQFFVFAFGAVPIVALAAVTSGIIPFISTGLTLALVMFAGTSSVNAWFPSYTGTIPDSVDWVRALILLAAVLALAMLVLRWQYRDRATGLSRIVAIVSLNVAGLLFIFMPGWLPLAVEEKLSAKPELASQVTTGAAFLPASNGPGWFFRNRAADIRIPFAITAANLPPGAELRADAVSIRFEWPDRSWKPVAMPNANRRFETEDAAFFDAGVLMNPALFREKLSIPFTARGTVYLTLFGEENRRTVSLLNGPANVQDGLQCEESQFSWQIQAIFCRSFFRWPDRLVYARGGSVETDFSNTRISYSPFPADIGLDPMEFRWGDPVKADEVTIITKKPLVHFHRTFEMRNIRLRDIAPGRLMPAK
jgi:hypothetical protein